MALTYGFYNSSNGDRKYNAEDFSEIFNGIINDGIFQSVGTAFVVKASDGLFVDVGIGRAWFNGTWTLNDSIMSLEAPEADLLYDRIDAVVLEVDKTIRVNSIKFVQGEAKTNPNNPALTKTTYLKQYPLCYISRKANSTTIKQADILNKVGSADTPFVTGILKTISLNELLGQWEDELNTFVANKTNYVDDWFNTKSYEYEYWVSNKQNDYDTWVSNKQNEYETLIDDRDAEFRTWLTNVQNDADERNTAIDLWFANKQIEYDNWLALTQENYTNWVNEKQSDYDSWINTNEAEFLTWFERMQKILNENVAANLQNQIDLNFKIASGGIESNTVFNSDGSIVTTHDDYTETTVFNSDGSITASIVRSDGNAIIKTTTFNSDGSITDTINEYNLGSE